jgi:hypothetical protein
MILYNMYLLFSQAYMNVSFDANLKKVASDLFITSSGKVKSMFLNSRLMFCMHKVDTFFSKCNALIQQHCSTKIVSYHTNETETQSQSIRDSGRDMQVI